MALILIVKHAFTRGLHVSNCCVRNLCSFRDLNPVLTKRLKKYGIIKPTEIQEKTFKAVLDGDNIVINSETGSGKTLAYALPVMQKVYEGKIRNKKAFRPHALVIVPNIELCYQVGDVFRLLLAAKVCLVTNDLPLRLIDTDIVLSTPQHITTYPMDVLNETKTIVFDEADIMIAKKIGKHGKKDPLFNLIKHFVSLTDGDKIILDNNNKERKQFVFVGATMPDSDHHKSKKAMPYIRSWVPDVIPIQGSGAHKIKATSDMVFLKVEHGNKTKLLIDMISEFLHESVCNKVPFKVIVYVNSVATADLLYYQLTTPDRVIVEQAGLSTGEIDNQSNYFLANFQSRLLNNIFVTHKNIPRENRVDRLNVFYSSDTVMLITTDITSRGLDIPDVNLVIQYDFATNVVDTLHRAGRTGRMGKQGKVVNFVTKQDESLALLVQSKYMDGDTADELFSRNRGLPRKLKRK